MKIGVTSQNPLKVDAVRSAYSIVSVPVRVMGYVANSGVAEQPVNEQALIGARNRILDVTRTVSDIDRIISIENGIFREEGQWRDRAVVVIYDPKNDTEYVAYSDAVVFPDLYVEKACEIGFDVITVGKVMAQAGYIQDEKDPHLSISGISRQVYIEKIVKDLVGKVEHL